ncbi:MAG TPA: divergent polysaccharide deacetylase family protein [Thermoanaerobaculia bacterium]|nr:divergent polysaccharide deacetylase family protein [Thermoanaerobaculia bacterium]
MVRRRGRRRGRPVRLAGVAAFLVLALATAAALWLAFGSELLSLPARAQEGEEPANVALAAAGAGAAGGSSPSSPAEPVPAPAAPLPPAPAAGAEVALVIDDLGRSLEDVRALGRLGVPVTYAVLPFETLTPQVAQELARRGEEVLLHLPMEGRETADPGPGALTLGMDEGAMRAALVAALDAVPGAVGVNNHMGSVLSADASSMRLVLGEVARRGLYFLDSRTTADSVGYQAARELGVPATQRQVFLDTDADPAAIREQFRRVLAEAARRGSAVAIGHPYPATLAVLAEEVPRAEAAGYRFVPVSRLLDRTALPAE